MNSFDADDPDCPMWLIGLLVLAGLALVAFSGGIIGSLITKAAMVRL